MRAALTLFIGTGLLAQSPSAPVGGRWTLGVQRMAPDLTGSAFIQDGATSSSFDLDRDLKLQKDSTALGVLLGYEGPRFLFQISTTGQAYEGRNTLTRTVTVNGTSYAVGTDLRSKVKVDAADLTWVIKVLRWESAYLGLDLGVQAWKLKVDASGTAAGITQVAQDDLTAPIPQVGASAGAHLFAGRLDLRGSYHLLSKSGATYHRSVLEGRFYPLTWLGLRVFAEDERFDVPKDSLSSDFALDLDRKGAGFGLVFRF